MKQLLILCGLAVTVVLNAQTNGTVVIDAVAGASPIIMKNVRKQSEVPQTKDTVLPTPSFTYKLQTREIPTEYISDTIPAARLANEPVSKLYRMYTRAGVGNYGSIYGEFDVMSLRSKNNSWHAHVRHFSSLTGPKDVQGFAGFSQNNVDLFGKRFLKKHVLDGTLNYSRDVVHYYGSADTSFNFERKDIRQRFQQFGFGAHLESHMTQDDAINHDIRLGYYHLNDAFKANEDNIRIAGQANRLIRKQEWGYAELGVDYNRNATPFDTTNNTIVWFKPEYRAQNELFDASIGIALYHEAKQPSSSTYFYPQGAFSMRLVKDYLVPYVRLTGALERNSYSSLTAINPFLLSTESTKLRNTQRKFDVSLGLRGSISSELAYDVRIGRYELVDAPFFVNATKAQDSTQNRFTLIWDNAKVLQFHGQLAWQQRDRIRFIASGDWFRYDMTTEAKAWHTPTLRLSLIGEYNLRDKIIARTQIYYLNGQYAKVANSNGIGFTTTTLKGLVDVNLSAEYRYTKFLSVFLNLNNIAAQRYFRWNAYPMQRFNLLAGLTFTF